MLAYLGMMLVESGLLLGTIKALQANPGAAQALPTQIYLGVRSSPVGVASPVLLNRV